MNKKLWLKYVKVYEEFNKEIPESLKILMDKIKEDIGHPIDSFKSIIDLENYGFVQNMKILLDVKFKKIENKYYTDKQTIYHSNINIYDVINQKSEIYLPIKIEDSVLNEHKLYSVISHEIQHLYDVLTIIDESDMKSFVNDLYLNKLRNVAKNIEFFNFLELVYLSLEHELIARNTMIYYEFLNCNVSKEKLIDMFYDSFMYKSLIKLKNFNYQNIINTPNIIGDTNDFINYFGGKNCKNEEDLIKFYSNWKKYFEDKSNEYLDESYKVIDDLMCLVKESYQLKQTKNVKKILLDTYNQYIK